MTAAAEPGHERGAKPTGSRVVVRAGTMRDIDAIKAVADREKHALGFVHRGSLVRAVAREELVVAAIGPAVAGFCQLYRRRDRIVTVYHVAVVPEVRGEGIGRALLASVSHDAGTRGLEIIRLKCPVDLPANDFYARIGFRRVAIEAGSGRPLNLWEFGIPDGQNEHRPSPGMSE